MNVFEVAVRLDRALHPASRFAVLFGCCRKPFKTKVFGVAVVPNVAKSLSLSRNEKLLFSCVVCLSVRAFVCMALCVC